MSKTIAELEKELSELYSELAEAEQEDDVLLVIALRKEIEEIERELGIRL
jgi:hypothetical protein